MGAAFIGLLVTIALYGVACLQTFSYYRAYKDDRIGMKVLVFVLLILETLHSIIVSHAMYFYLVRNFGNYIALNTAVWSIIIPVGLSCLTGTIVQCFFAWRIWLVSNRNWILSASICVFSVAQLSSGLAMMMIGFSLKEFSRLVDYKGVVASTLVTTTVADILIALSLCYYLNSRRTGFSTTDDAINTLIIFAINNGVVTSMVVIADLVTFLAMPKNLVTFALTFILGKVYANSLLSTLNSREYLRKQRHIAGGGFALELSSIKNNFTPGMGTKSPDPITSSSNSTTKVQPIDTAIALG